MSRLRIARFMRLGTYRRGVMSDAVFGFLEQGQGVVFIGILEENISTVGEAEDDLISLNYICAVVFCVFGKKA